MDRLFPAWRSRNKIKALKAVGELSSDVILLRVVKEGRHNEVRELAVRKITDQAILANLAVSWDIFGKLGYIARNRITDQNRLIFIMENATNNPLMRVGTIKMIQSPEVISYYAANDSFEGVRKAAMKMLDDMGYSVST